MKLTPSLRRGLLAAILLPAAALALAGPTHAAVINWGVGAQGISGNTDVSIAGTLVGAFNTGAPGVGNPTVNGVAFTGLALTGNSVTSGNFNLSIATTFQSSNSFGFGAAPFSSLSAPYQALLSSAAGDGATPFTLTMSALVTGQTYQFEWWTNDSNNPGNFITTATAGGVVALGSNTTAAIGGVGQFAIGTFIADATNQQVITFGSAQSEILNGFQLRQLAPPPAVPEPGTALAGVLALGVCGVLRRRAK